MISHFPVLISGIRDTNRRGMDHSSTELGHSAGNCCCQFCRNEVAWDSFLTVELSDRLNDLSALNELTNDLKNEAAEYIEVYYDTACLCCVMIPYYWLQLRYRMIHNSHDTVSYI